MIDRGKKNVLGILLDAVDYEAAVEKVLVAAHQRLPLAVSALAVHGVMTGVLEACHRYRLNRLDLVVPDGQPVRWALNLLHRTGLPERVYGPTLMVEVCRRAAEERLPIYLYGSRQPVLDALQDNLLRRFPDLEVAGVQPSRFRRLDEEEQRRIAAEIEASGASVTFVGLGCPRQEVWVYEQRALIRMPLLAVGAAFDFHAGLKRQAPALMQRLGLEWGYRLFQEPHRLWRRYALLNPLFVALILAQLCRLRRFDTANESVPNAPVRYG